MDEQLQKVDTFESLVSQFQKELLDFHVTYNDRHLMPLLSAGLVALRR